MKLKLLNIRGLLRRDRILQIVKKKITSFLIYIKNQNRPSYLCGDYNIDLLKNKNKNHFNDYFDELVTNGFFPKITLPTRIGDRSSSLYDNIFTNDAQKKKLLEYNYILYQIIRLYLLSLKSYLILKKFQNLLQSKRIMQP